ncbi:beta-1,2-xylosyltransferase XYXT1-like isoform X2 [Mangifera indica]|uniref:beta-1,2-xylosyltransferase XYXT1-like isoform X2 n=1 Tax=Mangifera indica TaxID=29780 RepID=UPI001CFAA99E|nr:beta-1,2-xylosyltransferase XYXT1-like isoform X2 [Mangifera indica]
MKLAVSSEKIKMTYSSIFARSFSRSEKKLGYGATGSLLMAFSIWIVFKHYLCQVSVLNLQKISVDASLEMPVVSDTKISGYLEGEAEEVKATCNFLETRSDYCEITGNVRVHGKSSSVSIASLQSGFQAGNYSRKIRPYSRKENSAAMELVKNWSVSFLTGYNKTHYCDLNHSVPAILFSLGGFSGNHFHDFSDLVVPLYFTTQQFNGEVQFLVTDYKPWWVSKFRKILEKLSRYEIIDIDKQENVHCFSSMIIGLKSHKELSIDPSKSPTGVSMKDFRNFLRSTYSLNRKTANKVQDRDQDRRPRLLIISRRKSRAFVNLGRISKSARILGYEVAVAEAKLSTDLSKFAALVNSCDVLMGVHGAGLTNMVFLPDNAVLIQIVPLGKIERLARDDFAEPSKEMNIRYLEYNIGVKESSLIEEYPIDHVIFRDPMMVHKQGWDAVKSIYLERQNVKLDMHRFKPTLSKALELLHH